MKKWIVGPVIAVAWLGSLYLAYGLGGMAGMFMPDPVSTAARTGVRGDDPVAGLVRRRLRGRSRIVWLRQQFRVSPATLQRVTRAAQKLQVLAVVASALGSRHDVIQGQIAEREVDPAAVAMAFQLPVESMAVCA